MSHTVSVRLLLTQSDARLVSFARAGHERAFEALVQRYRRPLLGYCRRLLLSEERAEDALQQALLQAWLALSAGTEVSDVKPWLYRIVHNSALNVLRMSGYDYSQLNESLSGADAPQADLDRRIAVREALAGLAALPEMQREALLRTAVEGRTHQQVARELGLSENALRGLVYRARSALRTSLGALVPPPVVSWALGAGGRGAPVVERLSEMAGGGSAGVAGLLMKGGAVAVTASVLAGGIATMHVHPKLAHRHSTAHEARDISQRPGATSLALAGGHGLGDVANASTPSPFPSPSQATVSRRRRVKPSAGTPPFRATAPANALLSPSLRTDGARGGASNGGEHHGALVSGANSPASSATSQGGKDGGRGGGGTESSTDGAGGTTGQDGKDGSSGESTSSGSSGDSQSQSAKPSSGGSDESANTGQSGESYDVQPSSQTAAPAGTGSSSITEQGPSSEGSKKD